mmetsp:Transcript_30772/g.99199  ORF Transcript_30772/g.99199 Transcript_30772/m.99199 type:complete len:228 (-) Transcript_30772:922-1605(-)
MALVWVSMRMVSPDSTRAMGPPSTASGATWPMQKPWVPPEKRPSVTRATFSERPAPTMAEVGVSISGMPGPPFGPWYRTTTTAPGGTSCRSMARRTSSSESKTCAGPSKLRPSLPVILPTAPSGARDPLSTARCPSALTGFDGGRTRNFSFSVVLLVSDSAAEKDCSARERPVMVRASEWGMTPQSIKYLNKAGVPPASWRSSMSADPQGFMSAKTGVRRRTRSKSS